MSTLIFLALSISVLIKIFDLFFYAYREKIKSSPVSETHVGSLLLQSTVLALLSPSLINHLDGILDSWSSESNRTRFHLLLFCLSPLTLWPIFLFLILMYFLGNNLFYFFDGISYLKNDDQFLFYFLADGRFVNLLPLGLFVFVFSGIFGRTSWFWVWSVILFFGGILSLNGAATIFLAGLAGVYFHFLIKLVKRSNNLPRQVHKLLKIATCLGIILPVLSLLLFGYFREFFVPSSLAGGSAKLALLLLCWIVILFPTLVGLMIWGHFTYQACLRSRLDKT